MPTHSQAAQRVAFFCQADPRQDSLANASDQAWRPLGSVALGLDDWGTLQGATLVERLRTSAGHPLDLPDHLARLRASAQVVGIQWPAYLTPEVVYECLDRNRAAHQAEDLVIVVLLTPGLSSQLPAGSRPTVIVHTADLPWTQLAAWYRQGQPLVTANNRNVPAECWSPHIKTRSRLHYYLADQQAAASGWPYAGAAMLSTSGHLTESSVANLLLIESDRLVSPPVESVLHGLSLRRTLRLAHGLGMAVQFDWIDPERAHAADGILLTGSSGCLWCASRLDDTVYAHPTEHSVLRALVEAWSQDIGVQFQSQALRLGS